MKTTTNNQKKLNKIADNAMNLIGYDPETDPVLKSKYIGIRTVGVFGRYYREFKDKIYRNEICELSGKTINNRQIQKITWYKNNSGNRGYYVSTSH